MNSNNNVEKKQASILNFFKANGGGGGGGVTNIEKLKDVKIEESKMNEKEKEKENSFEIKECVKEIEINNGETSTEDELVLKKKRKIQLDNSVEESESQTQEVGPGSHFESTNTFGNDKLRNLLYDPSKIVENISFEENKEHIKQIEKRKSEDSKRSQELDTIRNKYMNLPITLQNDKFRLYLEQYFMYCNTFEFPRWIQPDYIRDKNLRTPEDPNYDHTTIWTPPPEHKWAQEFKQSHYTPGMQQYWKIKSDNFDKLIFFKMGRFYEIFYIDACLLHQMCGLNWMGGEQKPHLGFPEQSLHMHAKKCIEYGHKVVVIEQMETPKELEQRNKESSGPKDKAVKREINEIYTKGTIIHDNMLSAETKYLVCFYFDEMQEEEIPVPGTNSMKCNFGFVVSDLATSYISVGYSEDDESRIQLRTILAQLCPAEILYCSKNIGKEVLSIFRGLPTSPELTGLPVFPNIIASMDEINKYFDRVPSALESYQEVNSVICSFGGFIVYLRSLLLDKKILKFCKVEQYDLFKKDNYMVLDATALKHLEILETQSGETKNSLYDYVNKTCTNFGARNLRRWVCSPLLDCDKINERLDAVEFLKNNEHILSLLRDRLKKLPDVERLLNKICIQASQSERGAVFFDNIVHIRLREFVNFLSAFQEVGMLLKELNESETDEPIPKRLFQICNTAEVRREEKGEMIHGCFPCIEQITNEFLNKIEIVNEKEYKPAEGCDEMIDEINRKEKEIENLLNDILSRMKKELKVPILKFVHAKYKYEIECPDNIPKSLLKHVEITSQKKGFIRIQTEEIKRYVEMLDDIEQEKKDSIYPFFQKVFQSFYTHYDKYTSATRLLSELDCLQSFAHVGLNSAHPVVRPIIHPMGAKVDEKNNPRSSDPMLILENNIHPVVASLMPNFISNNIYMNCEKEHQSTLLLTGPNMGGKSTLLRQSAISVILAQIGALVPGTHCELTIVDKIFTRLGSSDNLFEGKSTFLVELEDISNLLKQSTKYSLAILDELGRGTSSFDGTAIALSTLEQISDIIQCRCIFSTHYHLLVEEVKNNRNISNYHMSLSIDEEKEKIIFLYKFIKGVCPKSFGIHIAKLAGIPKEIIDLAHEKSLLFENVTDEFCRIIKYKNITRSLLDSNNEEAILDLYRRFKEEFS